MGDLLEGVDAADRRSEEGAAYIADLESKVAAERASGFERQLLRFIQTNPHLTIRQCWEEVEKQSAAAAGGGLRVWGEDFYN